MNMKIPTFSYITLVQRYDDVTDELQEAKNSLDKLCGSQTVDSFLQHSLQKQGYKRKQPSFSEVDQSQQQASDNCKWQRPSLPFRGDLQQQQVSDKSTSSGSSESTEESSSEDEYPKKKVAVQSSVVGGPQFMSKREVIRKQNPNKKIQLRNRRILGMVQNTLQKFKDEQIKREPQELKKIKVLAKIEAAVDGKREQENTEKFELFSKVQKYQQELQCLEELMQVTKSFEAWEKNQNLLIDFNLTKANPRIFFLPGKYTSSSNKHLEESRMEIKEQITKEREAVKMEIANIMESYQVEVSGSIEKAMLPEDKTSTKMSDDSTGPDEEKNDTYDEPLHLGLSEDESDITL